MADYHLAQINVALANAPFDSPELAEFLEQVDAINAPADQSPGFIWRLQTPEGNTTGVRINDDDRLFLNLTVWESVEALREYAYRSGHIDVMRRRKEWFVPYGSNYLAMWWVPAVTLPTVDEGLARIEYIDEYGASAHAFGFRQQFPPESQGSTARRLATIDGSASGSGDDDSDSD